MKNLSSETCQRLKDAGFPQPEKAIGQMWYVRSVLCVIFRTPDAGFFEITDIAKGVYAAALDGYGEYANNAPDDWVYCPAALEIARWIPDSSIHAATHGVFFVHYVTTGHQTTVNPAIELAEIWLSENAQK